MVIGLWFLLIMSWRFHKTDADRSCIPRKYNHESHVCVCNSTYCDEISKIIPLDKGKYVFYVSSLKGDRFKKYIGNVVSSTSRKYKRKRNRKNRIRNREMSSCGMFCSLSALISKYLFQLRSELPSIVRSMFELNGDVTLKITRNKTFQTIHGFGGSFTDATGFNLEQLSEETKENFAKSYFSDKGLEYNIVRVPIGGTDFSTHPYAYNMEPEDDLNLSNFSLTMEDYNYKIPLIHKTRNLTTDEIYLIASAWSPPVWMKSNKAYKGVSRLLKKYYQTWANYHLKFFEEYAKNDIRFWSVTLQNEPSNGVLPLYPFNSVGWLPGEQADWLVNNFGPTIKGSRFSDMKILALDDSRFLLPWWIHCMSANKNASDYIDGIATHWYYDDFLPPILVDLTHNAFPEKFFISTEACGLPRPGQSEAVELGSWLRAENYIRNIIEDLNHWYTGWIDWNLALDRQGGPNWANNYVDAPIITFPENDEFVKQPLFYAMGHFSKFIPRGSKRVFVDKVVGDIDSVAFLRPDGGIAVIFYNPYDSMKIVTIQEDGTGYFKMNVDPHSVYSVIYW